MQIYLFIYKKVLHHTLIKSSSLPLDFLKINSAEMVLSLLQRNIAVCINILLLQNHSNYCNTPQKLHIQIHSV